jgi:phosphoribosyl-AMP cyclohydrolase
MSRNRTVRQAIGTQRVIFSDAPRCLRSSCSQCEGNAGAQGWTIVPLPVWCARFQSHFSQRPAMNAIELDFEKLDGLLPAIVQDVDTGAVLMLGFMNREAWDKTLRLGKVTFFSRTRNVLWTKGETSGNFLEVREIFSDCDSDTVLIKAVPHGPTCHTGATTCFFNKITP